MRYRIELLPLVRFGPSTRPTRASRFSKHDASSHSPRQSFTMVRITPTRILCAVVMVTSVLIFFYISSLLFGERGYDIMLERPPPARSRPPNLEVTLGEECSPFSSGVMDDVAVVLKLGSAEVKEQLPAYLNRLGRCKLDLLIFSDRHDEYNGFKIVDALANLRPEYRYNNPDFDIYDRIQEENNTTMGKTEEGWRLDKYKFLPIIELTAHLRPESRWFVFVELDTYVNWDNMYRFLSRFNPKTPYYFGSPIWPRKKTIFAHGGSGFVLSRGAMNKMVARGRMFAENHHFPGTHLFGKDFSKQCCGDEVLAQVLKECGVSIRGYWPMFNGEKPTTVRFGWEQWCEAILTLHHVQEGEHDALKSWEFSRTHPAKPLTFEELFTYIERDLRDQVDDWSNVSDDITHTRPHSSAKSADKCHSACKKDRACMQWEHSGDACRLSHVIRLGHAQGPDGDRKWVSGWMLDRIKAFRASRSPCHGAHFVHANP